MLHGVRVQFAGVKVKGHSDSNGNDPSGASLSSRGSPPAAGGLVLLSVSVSSQGHPVQVRVKQSSGVFTLDEAAVDAVRGWEFKPTRIGPLAADSEVEAPVRFQLIK